MSSPTDVTWLLSRCKIRPFGWEMSLLMIRNSYVCNTTVAQVLNEFEKTIKKYDIFSRWQDNIIRHHWLCYLTVQLMALPLRIHTHTPCEAFISQQQGKGPICTCYILPLTPALLYNIEWQHYMIALSTVEEPEAGTETLKCIWKICFHQPLSHFLFFLSLN